MLERLKKKVFIHHDGALGDTLLSLPCISLIRESASHIHLAGRGDVTALLKEAGIVDAVSSADSVVYSSLYADSMDETADKLLAAYDALYLFTVHQDSQISRQMRQISPDVKVISTIPPEDSYEHVAEYRLRQCGYGREELKRDISFRIPEEEMTWAKGFLKDRGNADCGNILIALHPGSGGRKKCWPRKQYEALISLIAVDPRMICMIFSGPAEDDETVALFSQLAKHNRKIIHLHDERLVRVAALLTMSDYYLGNDSGISHLAGVLQCRGMVLFGPTNSRLWRPYGSTMDVLRFESEGPDMLSAGQVYAGMKNALAPKEAKIDFQRRRLI